MKIVYKKNHYPVTTKRIARALYGNYNALAFVEAKADPFVCLQTLSSDYGIHAKAKPVLNKESKLIGFVFKNNHNVR